MPPTTKTASNTFPGPDRGTGHRHSFYYDCEEGGGDDDSLFDEDELFDEEADYDEDYEDWEEEDENDDDNRRVTPMLLLPSMARQQASGLLSRLFGRGEDGDEAGHPDDLSDECQRRGGVVVGYPSDGSKSAKLKDADNVEVEFRGSFEKRSPWWVTGWRPRSYILRGRRLLYFDPDRPDRPLGVLDFNITRYELHCCWAHTARENEQVDKRQCNVCDAGQPLDWSKFYLKPLRFANKVFAFRGPSFEMRELAKRITGILESAARSSGLTPSDLPVAVTPGNFWRYPFMLESTFLQQAESGDLLLFRGKEARHARLRTITRSQYDHVALMLRTAENSLMIFEATGSEGVSSVSWKMFRDRHWENCYSQLTYRKVFFRRDQKQLTVLQNFILDALGTEYELTLPKLFQRRHSREFDADGNEITPSEQAVEQEDAKGFFCSELVAACLKRCGVLSGDRAAAQYWPGSFGQQSRGALPLHEEVYIGEEQTLIYDL
eukprot:TRINITY_DN23769_c0_g1_i1.p1 TRINITY_DN23769_c0_g1~~TRINITY_DN23769_c0_g1_i1.p1  ORF type:complete len:492 (+),score=92.53 TRINITY_DN23769_c0_g1_i1:132-1607(+)